MKKRIIFIVIALAIVSMFITSCGEHTIFGNENNGITPSTCSYYVDPNIEETYSGRDLPALPPGTELFFTGRATVLDTLSQQMVPLSDTEPADIISMGVIGSGSVISAVVRLNNNQTYGVSFLARFPNGDWQKLNTLPTIYTITDNDTTEVVLDQLYQSRSFDDHFPHGYNKAYQYYHGFSVDNIGNIQSYGDFSVDDLREVLITWDGQSNWTSNEEGTQIIPVPDSLLMYFTEPIDQGMDIKIKISNNYYYQTSMVWDADSLYFKYATMILPGIIEPFYQNLSIYEASNQASMKMMGVEVDNVELMNIYRFYTEDLFTYEIVNDVVYNVQTLDLRGTLGIIYP